MKTKLTVTYNSPIKSLINDDIFEVLKTTPTFYTDVNPMFFGLDYDGDLNQSCITFKFMSKLSEEDEVELIETIKELLPECNVIWK